MKELPIADFQLPIGGKIQLSHSPLALAWGHSSVEIREPF
jgi:hypothetical protein